MPMFVSQDQTTAGAFAVESPELARIEDLTIAVADNHLRFRGKRARGSPGYADVRRPRSST